MLAGAKRGHDFLLLFGSQPPMQQPDAERRQRLLQVLELLRDGFDPVGAGFLNPRIDHIRLPALRQFAADERPHLRQLIRRADKGLDAPAAGRQLVNDGHVQLAVKRQPQRARNGRRGHHQQMRIMALAHELLALRHAELVLLVNDHQAKVVRRKPGLDQRVRADGEGRVAAGCGCGCWIRTLGLTLDFGLWTLDFRRLPAARPQFHGDAQRLQPVREVLEVLFRQNFGRGHERDVVAAFQRHQRAARRHDRLAGADIALQQPSHRVRAGQVLAQLAQDFGLRRGQLKAEPGQKGLDEMVVAAARQRLGFGLEIPPAPLNLPLEVNELIQRQPPPCQLGIRRVFPGSAACGSPGRATASSAPRRPNAVPAKARESAPRIGRGSAR